MKRLMRNRRARLVACLLTINAAVLAAPAVARADDDEMGKAVCDVCADATGKEYGCCRSAVCGTAGCCTSSTECKLREE